MNVEEIIEIVKPTMKDVGKAVLVEFLDDDLVIEGTSAWEKPKSFKFLTGWINDVGMFYFAVQTNTETIILAKEKIAALIIFEGEDDWVRS